MGSHVFVYGTLRTPVEGSDAGDTHYHHRIVDHIVESCGGYVDQTELYDCGPYPALRRGSGRVFGELLEITEVGLAITDVIEGHPDFYERSRVEVQIGTAGTSHGESVEAWTYFAPDSVMPTAHRIPSGDWFDRQRGLLPNEDFSPEDPELALAFDRLASSHESWVSTVRPNGKPHLVPMWHVDRGGRLYMATERTSVKMRNLEINPSVVIAHPDPRTVVYADGWAIERADVRSVVSPLFVEKYDWDPAAEESVAILEVSLITLTSWPGDSDERRRWRM